MSYNLKEITTKVCKELKKHINEEVSTSELVSMVTEEKVTEKDLMKIHQSVIDHVNKSRNLDINFEEGMLGMTCHIPYKIESVIKEI